jgi:FK506-binding protein 2
MRTSILAAASVLLAPFALALDKPLNTEVTVEAKCNRKTQRGDRIDVHYRGTLESDGAFNTPNAFSLISHLQEIAMLTPSPFLYVGSEFDASYNRGSPLSFTVGKGQVIKGWDEGLLDMCPGEKRKLTIQPEWAYGSRAMGPIPANSVLIFETELVSIAGVEPEKEEL